MKLSISYITAREEPRLDWLVDSLEKQASPSDEVELLVVDAFGRPASALGFRSIKAITRLVETRPKPSIWQGPHRVTAHDFYANSNARNTALVLASTNYICFLDDRCALDPGWLDVVRRGERKRSSVLCGTYTKHADRGSVVDHRRELEPRGKRDCSGGWCFGCNVALPLDWALKINGFEEGCDPVGLEDCIFGHMLSNAGYRLDFVVEMAVQLDRSGPVHPPNFPRQDKGQSPKDKSHALVARFSSRKRTEFTPDLKKLRAELARGGSFPVPDPHSEYRDWYDDSSLKGASMPIFDRARATGSTGPSGTGATGATGPNTITFSVIGPILAGPFAAVIGAMNLIDPTAGAITVNFPKASLNPGSVIVIKNPGASANTINLTPFAGDLIEGGNPIPLTTPNRSEICVSDGVSQWRFIGTFPP